MPLFLVSLWLFSFLISDMWAAIVGAAWIVGRLLYLAGYARAAEARETGFMIQALATGVLLFGALGMTLWDLFGRLSGRG
jgi:hypothetical protein